MPKLPSFIKSHAILALLLLQACSTTPTSTQLNQQTATSTPPPASLAGDGPPMIDRDVSTIPNALPKSEAISKYGNPPIYEVFGKQYRTLSSSAGYEAEGTASWYGRKFHGQRTSSGETYDMYAMTAAHRSLPLPTYVKVKNLKNGKEVILKVNDRGPFVHNRLIDVSYAAAKKLGFHEAGTGKVLITAIDPEEWHKQKSQLADNNKDHQKHYSSKKEALAQNSEQLYLQLGAFSQKLNAQKLADSATHLTQAFDHVNVQVYENKIDKKDIYKVLIGPLKNKIDAQKLQKELITLNASLQATLIYEKMLPFK